MPIYWNKEGRIKLIPLTLTASLFWTLTIKNSYFWFYRVKDPGMDPFLRCETQVYDAAKAM